MFIDDFIWISIDLYLHSYKTTTKWCVKFIETNRTTYYELAINMKKKYYTFDIILQHSAQIIRYNN